MLKIARAHHPQVLEVGAATQQNGVDTGQEHTSVSGSLRLFPSQGTVDDPAGEEASPTEDGVYL